MTEQDGIPLPIPTPISKPFWAACADHRLTVQKCGDCGELGFIPQAFCRQCLSEGLSWVDSSGVGRIYSYTVVWRPQTPAFDVPYVVAIVDMDDGYHMLSNITDCEPDDVAVGMLVEVWFDDLAPGVTLPKFRPRGH